MVGVPVNDPQSVNRMEEQKQSDPLAIPDIRSAMELFPDSDPNQLLRVYTDCGRDKNLFINTLFAL